MLKALFGNLFRARGGAASHRRLAARSRSRGEWESALQHSQAEVRIDDASAAAWNDLGLAHCALGQFEQARDAYGRAVERDPRLLPALLNLGGLLSEETQDFPAAEDCFRRALGIAAEHPEALARLGLCLQEQGRVDEAIGCFREALRVDSGHEGAAQWLLFALNLVPGLSPHALFEEHRRWARVHADPVTRLPPRPREPGPWRLGFVSGDFRGHSTSKFVLPLLASLDRSRFQVFCYSASARADETTERFRSFTSRWRDIGALGDGPAAELIRSDAPDVLVDLSGHTRGNRLGVFARKPAPVTATWLGYLNTTGMSAMDYRITDARADPAPMSDAFHSETLIRLPETSWCYEAPASVPEVAPRPEGRPLALGSCNHVAKLNDEVIALWSRILNSLPQARLTVMAITGDRVRARIVSEFARNRVETNRIGFLPRVDAGRYWQALSEIDIALDPFPYNGGATTCDCLWMGVPTVTLAGSHGFSRTGASILGAAGLPEFVASGPEAYHSLVLELASTRDRLARLRGELRGRLRASALMDGNRLARAFEDAIAAALRRAGAFDGC